MSIAVPRRILPVIVLSQFAGTSLWFAVNAVMPDLQRAWGLPAAAVGVLTFGFAISIVSIELFVRAAQVWPLGLLLPWLALGPALGWWLLRPLLLA
jgi:DHA1 family inner membrane transport protein